MAKRRDIRLTRQRRTILDELRKMKWHPSADEVYEAVRRRLPHISLGTVYRNLEILSEYGMIQKLEYGGFQRRFDGNLEKHYHVRCVRCGRVEDIPIEPLGGLDADFSRQTDYEVFGHRLEFIGLCPKCKLAEEPSAGENSNRKEKQR